CLVAKLGGFAVDADLIEEKPDTACRPKPWHVFVGRLTIVEMQFVSKRLFAAADFAGQLRFDIAGAAVSTRYDQLISFKQIRQISRVHFRCANSTAEIQLQIR